MNTDYIRRISDLEQIIMDWKKGLYESEEEWMRKVDELICRLYWIFRGSDKEE